MREGGVKGEREGGVRTTSEGNECMLGAGGRTTTTTTKSVGVTCGLVCIGVRERILVHVASFMSGVGENFVLVDSP